MHFEYINWVAVLVSAIITMILGMIWYSPQVFGKTWACTHMKDTVTGTMGTMGTTKTCEASAGQYVGSFVAAFVAAAVLALFINWTHTIDAAEGAAVGIFAWMGFILTTLFSGFIWGHKTLVGFVVHAGFYLVNFIIIGALLGAWQ
jgi:hypothetical protein